MLESFCCYCFVTSLSWVTYPQHSAQRSNKIITTVYLQKNDSSISPEWSFLWNARIVLFINDSSISQEWSFWRNSRVVVFALALNIRNKYVLKSVGTVDNVLCDFVFTEVFMNGNPICLKDKYNTKQQVYIAY